MPADGLEHAGFCACSRRGTMRETNMSLTTRAVGALAVLSLAAIPVTALSIQSTSWDDHPSVAASKGGEAAGNRVAAGEPVAESRGCNSDCTVSEARHASRLVAQNITPDTDIGSLASADYALETHALVPQNPGATTGPAEQPSQIETSSTDTEPASTPHRKRVYKRKHVSKNTVGAGSFQLLFQGPGK